MDVASQAIVMLSVEVNKSSVCMSQKHLTHKPCILLAVVLSGKKFIVVPVISLMNNIF